MRSAFHHGAVLTAALPLALSAIPVFATTFTVTTTADDGAGSLREAMSLAQNCAGGPYTVAFNVPASSLTGGVAIITLSMALPTVYCAGTTIDGTTQTANHGNTNDVTLGTGGVVGTGPDGRPGTGDEPSLPRLNGPEVEIDASRLPGSALVVFADDVTIRGLSLHGGGDITSFESDFGNIDIQGGNNILVERNVLGASALSFSRPGGEAFTLTNLVRVSGASNLTIRQNLMGFNNWFAVFVRGEFVSNLTIQQNEIAGSDAGIVSRGFGASPGGTFTVTGNLVRDLVSNGTEVTPVAAALAQNAGSAIVTDNTFRNTGYGLGVNVGAPFVVRHNLVSDNPNDGLIVGGSGWPTMISGNSVFGNRLGIELLINGVGVSTNDGLKSKTQTNNGMDYPIFTKALLSGTSLSIEGYVGNQPAGSATFADATVEVFTADNNPPNQNGEIVAGDGLSVPHGEGRIFIGSVSADALGKFSAILPVPAGVALTGGDAITSTATDAGGNTSEFGADAVLQTPSPTPTKTATATPTATPTVTRTSTPTSAPPVIVPTMSSPMLALLALALAGIGWLASGRR